MSTKNKLSGNFFFREQGDAPDNSGRKLMMICGVVAVPKDFPIKGEYIYPVLGETEKVGLGFHYMTIDPSLGKDLTDVLKGSGSDGIFTAPIWRV